MTIPQELHYTAEHEWVRIEGNTATIGITEFAQGELGDIVYVDVNTIGEHVNHGDVFGTVEAVKTVSDLYMPVSGKVTEFNTELENAPQLVNEDPYGKGWMIKMAIEEGTDVSHLLSSEAYHALVSK